MKRSEKGVLKRALSLGLALPVLTGCAVFEAIFEGLDRTVSEFDDAPAAFVATVRIDEDDGHRYQIERVAIADNRPDRSHVARFEGVLRRHAEFPAIRFPGTFTDLALRPDGARLVAIVEEDIVGDLETYLIITDTTNDRVLAAGTLLGPPQNALVRTCGVDDAFRVALRQEVEAFADPPVPQGSTLDVTLFGEGRLEDQLVFVGWSASGDPIFEATFQPYAEVRIGDELIADGSGNSQWLRGLFIFRGMARYSADTGALLDCNTVDPFPDVVPLYEMRAGSDGRSLVLIPATGGDFTLSDILGNPFRVSGRIRKIAPPYE